MLSPTHPQIKELIFPWLCLNIISPEWDPFTMFTYIKSLHCVCQLYLSKRGGKTISAIISQYTRQHALSSKGGTWSTWVSSNGQRCFTECGKGEIRFSSRQMTIMLPSDVHLIHINFYLCANHWARSPRFWGWRPTKQTTLLGATSHEWQEPSDKGRRGLWEGLEALGHFRQYLQGKSKKLEWQNSVPGRGNSMGRAQDQTDLRDGIWLMHRVHV